MASSEQPFHARTRGAEQNQRIEAAYRRGYHHGLVKALELTVGLLDGGMPKHAIIELMQVFERHSITPWRSAEAQGSSLPPQFDLEACQRLLREMKRDQST